MAVILGIAACGQVLQYDDAAPPTAPARPAPSAPIAPLEVPEDAFVQASLDDQFPLVRFKRYPDGSVMALITVPPTTGKFIVENVLSFCECLTREPEESRAEAELLENSGGALVANVTAPGGNASFQPGSWQALEDVLRMHGTEADVIEMLLAIDLYYNAAPQIEIQAEIFEITDSTFFERGIVPINDTTPLFDHRSGVSDEGGGPFLRAIGGVFPTGGGQGLTSGTGGAFQFGSLANNVQIQALLQFLESSENVDIVSRPSVVVRSGVVAALSSSEQYPVLEPTAISTQGVTTNKILYKSVGVTLNVLPFLMGGNTVHLVIEAEVSRIGRTLILATDTAGKPIFSPTINTRKANTVVMVRDGLTVVLGGLKLREERKIRNKVPFLGDLPILDLVFSSTQTEEVDTEVLFVIRPVVKSRPSISPIGELFDPFADSY